MHKINYYKQNLTHNKKITCPIAVVDDHVDFWSTWYSIKTIIYIVLRNKCEGRFGSLVNKHENDELFTNNTGKPRKKKFQVFLSGGEPKTFQLLVRMLYH